MATERIERLISPDVLTSFQELRALVDANVEGFEKLVAAGVELNTNIGKAKTFKDMNAEITKLKENEIQLRGTIAELQLAMEALNKKKSEGTSVTNQLEKANKRLEQSYSNEARELAKTREQQILVNKANKQSAQETLGLVDAYRRLELEYNKAERAARNLVIQNGANNKETQEALALVQQLDAQLKEADYSVGKFGRNVGNYGSALKTLEQYLADVRTELTKTKTAAVGGLSLSIPTAGPASRTPTGPVRGNTDQATQAMVKYGKATADSTNRVAELSKQEQLLSRIVESQIAGYASATQEIKSNEKALQALAAAGLQNTQFYQALLKDTAELKDNVGDLKDEIKALASDTRQFDLVAGAVTGLVNVFQVGVGAATLFGAESADVQKSIERLMAVQNIAQGIQELANDLTTKGTALNKLYNFVIGEGAAARQANTVATVESTVATEAQTVATEGAAVATATLTTGMKVLRGALAASGIGLLIVGIVYLIGKIQEWQQADLNLIKQQTALNQVLLETLRINKEIGELTKTDIGTEVQGMKNRIAAAQAYGRSQGEILAAELKLAEARRDAATFKFFDTGGFGEEGRLQKDLEAAATAYKDIIAQQAKIKPDDLTEEMKAQKELAQSTLELAKEKFTEQKQIDEEYVNFNNELTAKQLQIQRLNLDERRKLVLEFATLSANAQIEANGRALADERTTLEQRITLVKSNMAEQEKIARAQRENVRTDPSASKNDQRIAARNLQTALNKITADGEAEQFKIREDYRKRDQQARLTSIESIIGIAQKQADDIKNNENRSLAERISAAKDGLDYQIYLINQQKDAELSAAGLTAAERTAIEDQANQKIFESRLQFGKDISDITLSSLEKEGDKRLAIANKNNSDELSALNKKYADGLLTTEQFERERLKIGTKYAAETLSIQADNIQKRIDYERTQLHDVTGLEAELAAKRKEISDQLTEDLIKNEQALYDKKMEFQQALTDLFVSLDDASIERQKENLDRESEAVEERKQRETDFVNQQVLTEQEKAEALKVIDEKSQRDKEVIAERQRKLDEQKARTDKVVAAAKVIADTAQAVFRLSADAAAARAQAALLLANPVTAAYAPIAAASAIAISSQIPLVIGLGAVNLAKILGTKAFRFGGKTTENAPILVGDNYQSEYMVNKEGQVVKTPAVPTVLMAEADTTIYPNKKSLEAAIGDSVYSSPVSTDTGAYYRYMTKELGGKIDRLTKTVKEKKETHIHPGKNGWAIMNNEGGQISEYLSKSLR
jgi:hypothetical protein